MDALLQYGSEDEDSGSERELDKAQRPSKRSKGLGEVPAGLAAGASAAQPALAPRSLLPPAAALLDGSYSPPPVAQQQELARVLLHQGRIRTFPHVTGNFPTHVYVEVPTAPACLSPLGQLLSAVSARMPALQAMVHAPASSGCQGAALPSAAHASGDAPRAAAPPQGLYHVSLSRTVPLKLHQIEPLIESLRQRLRQQDTFSIRIGRPEVLVNDERTRTFLALAACRLGTAGSSASSSRGRRGGSCIDNGRERGSPDETAADGCGSSGSCAARRPPHAVKQEEQQREEQRQPQQAYSPHLVALCHAVSSVFAAHGLAPFHAEPRPHASVAWLLGDQQEQLQAALAAPKALEAAERLAAEDWQLSPGAIICKAGPRPFTVWQAGEPWGGAAT